MGRFYYVDNLSKVCGKPLDKQETLLNARIYSPDMGYYPQLVPLHSHVAHNFHKDINMV